MFLRHPLLLSNQTDGGKNEPYQKSKPTISFRLRQATGKLFGQLISSQRFSFKFDNQKLMFYERYWIVVYVIAEFASFIFKSMLIRGEADNEHWCVYR